MGEGSSDADARTSEKHRNELYTAHQNEIWKRQVSNADNLDKTILASSTASLAFSLAFLKDFVPINEASWAALLYGSWFVFGSASVVTILSFTLSQWSLEKTLAQAKRYYLENDESAFNESNFYEKLNRYSSYLSTILFVAGLVFTVLFASINLERYDPMRNKTIAGTPGLKLQPAPGTEKRGAPSPGLQPTKPTTNPPASPTPATPAQPKQTSSTANAKSTTC